MVRNRFSERMMLRLTFESWKALPRANREGRASTARTGKGKDSRQEEEAAQGMKKTSVTGTERKRHKSGRHLKGRNKKNCRYLEYRPLRR